MNSLLSAIKAFVLKNRTAYKDYLGNGKYDIKKLPEECIPDSVNNKIRIAQRKANDAQRTANDARRTASDALNTATNTATQINDVTTFVTVFASLEATKNKERHNFAENIWANGTSALPLAEARAPMKCHFDIMLNDSSNHNIKHYVAFEGKIVREVTKRSDTYCLFIDESVEVVNDCFANLKIGYKFSNDDNLWHKFIRAEVTLPDADYNNTSITTIILNASGVIPDTYDYAPWPSICVPIAGTNDAGVVYASDKTDDQTVPVSIDKNGYLWCKGSETTTPDWNQNDPTASDYIKNRPFYTGEQIFTEIIPEQTYTLSSIGGGFTSYEDSSGTYPYSLEESKDYTVVYNGTTYELTSASFQNLACIGDVGPLTTGSEPSVPFAILAGSGMLQIVDYNGNTEVTFKIIGNRADIIPIDLKYIPELPGYMSKQNPVCNGSFSLNRKADTTVGVNSHAEGDDTTASGDESHAEGNSTIASGPVSHAEGWYTEANAKFSHAEGLNTTASGESSHSEGDDTTASGKSSHAEGAHTTVSTTEMSVSSLTVEDGMGKYGHAEGFATVVTGQHGAHAEGCKTLSSGKSSHAEGNSTTASGDYSHAEGNSTTASGDYSHAEGNRTNASGKTSHAEGELTTASGVCSHAEGVSVTASGTYSHAEGQHATASGTYSHAEGSNTIASGLSSHAEGLGTTTSGDASHVQGKYNIDDPDGKYAHVVGNGKSHLELSNAHTLDWEGNAWFAGTVEGTAMIVKSSTPNSTKKFKITVDDSGTISATEVI